MTLEELGYTVCDHPAQRLRPGRTKVNCEVCGALKSNNQWIGGSVKFEFDKAAIAKRHAKRINAMFTN